MRFGDVVGILKQLQSDREMKGRREEGGGGGKGVSYPGPCNVGGAPRPLGVRQPAKAPWVAVVLPGPKLALNGPG